MPRKQLIMTLLLAAVALLSIIAMAERHWPF
jgi:hypothetical protein